jgi:hypothetical protein
MQVFLLMKEIVWAAILVVLNLFANWIVSGPWIPQDQFEAPLVGA